MYVIDAIPLAKIPVAGLQIVSYFSREELLKGVLVRVAIGRRQLNALVVGCHDMKTRRTHIKRSEFALKSIQGVITDVPIFASWQFTLLKDLAEYYAAPLPYVCAAMVPNFFIHRKTFLKLEQTPPMPARRHDASAAQPTLVQKVDRTLEYRQYIEDCLAQKKQVLILAPTAALLERHRQLCADYAPVMITGALTSRQLFSAWNDIRLGKARCIIGTRSALFAPFFDLGTVILDEEHSESYKSWDMFPYYHTKTVAQQLTRLSGAHLVYGSAAPSVETRWRAEHECYRCVTDTSRGSVTRPVIVDMRNEIFGGNYRIFSYQLQHAIRDALADPAKKILLFIARRGSDAFSFCGDCENVERCPRCSAHLVLHTAPEQMLICHACGFTTNPRLTCSRCGSHRIRTFGAGTQKVKEEFVQEFGAEHTPLILDTDTAPTARKQEELIAAFASGSSRILIATQIVLQKHTMPSVAVCAVLSLDNLLYIPDFSTAERVFHIVGDLARYCAPNGKFFFQTHIPENGTLTAAAAQDYEAWYRREIMAREELHYPPFSHMIKVVVKADSLKTSEQSALTLAAELKDRLEKEGALFELLGPAPAYYPKVGRDFVHHIVIKLMALGPVPRARIVRDIASRATIDVDPISIL